MTVKEATESWVNSFNAIPQGLLAKLIQHYPEEWQEVTKPDIGDKVYLYSHAASGEIVDCFKETDNYQIKLDNGTEITSSANDFEVVYDYALPIWGTLWSFGNDQDNHWLEDDNGIELMSQCGFRIFEHEEFGYFFGIDGGGYDFFAEHWIPLYKARGLQWHNNTIEKRVAI